MNKEKIAFENKCYEAYKLWWMLSHGNSVKELFDVIVGLAAETVDNDPLEAATTGDAVKQLASNAADQFVSEVGFGSGSLWVCKEEFMTAEFANTSFMNRLFKLMDNGENMKEFYEKNYRKDQETEDLKPFFVTMKVEARFIPKVMATNVRTAKKKVNDEYLDADFGPLEDINGDCIMVEDGEGNYLWEA